MPSYGLGTTASAFDFPLPSGNTCRMKHADLQALIASGVVDSVDQLTALVQTDHVERVKKGAKKPSKKPAESFSAGLDPAARSVLELMKDPKRWASLEKVVDAVVVSCVEEPRVLPARLPGQEYNASDGAALIAGEAFAVNNVALIDRFAIFGEAMRPLMAGQAAMQPFRAGPEEAVADVADGEDVQPAPE